jgi:ammonia channel protein AmtB
MPGTAFTALAAFLMVLGIGLKQMRIIRGQSLPRALAAAFFSFALAALGAAGTLAIGGSNLAGRFELQSMLLIAFTVTAVAASDVGRTRAPAFALLVIALGGALATAQLVADWSASLTFIAGSCAGLGGLFVLGARARMPSDKISAVGRLAAILGMLALLIGWGLVWIATGIEPMFVVRALGPAAGAAFIAASTISFLFGRRGLSRNLDQGLLGALAGMLAISSALYLRWDPVIAGAAAGTLSALFAGAFARLKLDDASGFVAALLACGLVRIILPEILAGDREALSHLPESIGVIVLCAFLFGFLLALLLQVTIGLRPSTENRGPAIPGS